MAILLIGRTAVRECAGKEREKQLEKRSDGQCDPSSTSAKVYFHKDLKRQRRKRQLLHLLLLLSDAAREREIDWARAPAVDIVCLCLPILPFHRVSLSLFSRGRFVCQMRLLLTSCLVLRLRQRGELRIPQDIAPRSKNPVRIRKQMLFFLLPYR